MRQARRQGQGQGQGQRRQCTCSWHVANPRSSTLRPPGSSDRSSFKRTLYMNDSAWVPKSGWFQCDAIAKGYSTRVVPVRCW